MRDSQRSRVYSAERQLSDRGARLETVQEMQAVVDSICRSRWFRNRFGSVRITVRDGRGRRAAGGIGWRNTDGRCGYITMPRWSRHTLFVLHEITHVIQPHGTAAHGREFARFFLQLVGWHMGATIAAELRAAYKRCGVKYVRVSR